MNGDQNPQGELERTRNNTKAILKTINSVVVEFSTDQERFLDRVSRIIRDAFTFDHVAIFVVDPDKPILTKRAQSSKFEKTVPRGIGQQVSEGFIGFCAQKEMPFYVNDVKAGDPLDAVLGTHDKLGNFITGEERIPRDRYLDKISGTRSELCCPIIVGGKVRGVLNIEHEAPNQFLPGLLEGFMAVCKHIGNVIQYAEQGKRYVDIQVEAELVKERLNLVLDALGNMSVMTPAEVIRRALERLAKETRARGAVVYGSHTTDGETVLEREVLYGSTPKARKKDKVDGSMGVIQRVLREAVTERRFLAPDESMNRLAGTQMKSFVVAPMRQRGSAKGMLLLIDPERAESESELEEIARTVQAVANVVGMLRVLQRKRS